MFQMIINFKTIQIILRMVVSRAMKRDIPF